MRKNLHHKIMLSLLAGSLALGFVYALPAFAEDVLIADTSYTSPDGTQGTYNLDADGTNNGTNYGDADGYTSITLPTGPIDKFTVTAGNGGNIENSAQGSNYTGGNGGNVTLTFNETVTGIINATGGNGGNIEDSDAGGNYTGGNGGNVTLTFNETVTGIINATGGNGGNIENSDAGGNYTGGNGGIVTLTFDKTVTGNINATGGNGGNIENSAKGGNLTGGNGGIVTLTFDKTVTGNINATGGNGGNIKNSVQGSNYTGGNGGDVILTFDKTVTGNINATGGNGGNIENSAQGSNYTGGNGGDVILTFNDVVTDNITATAGNGGSVNFTANSISGKKSVDSSSNTTTGDIDIELTKNNGDITFDVGTLNIDDNTVTITVEDNSGNSDNNSENNIVIGKTGDNHIENLILTGSGDFKTVDENGDKINDITVGSLTIDGGTINDTNWGNYNNLKTTKTSAEIGGKGIIFSTDSEIEWSKGLTDADNLTTPGNLTKTGTGTLILGKENGNNTYDYSGLTVVEQGTLDASASALTASKGLTLLGDTTFVGNPTQNWNGKQLAVYDNGSVNSATYQGNLNAQNSNLYFIASGDNTNPLLSVTGSADISGSKYNIGFTGKTTFDEGQTLTLIEADGTIDASGLQQGNGIDGINGINGIKFGSTITQSITDVTTVPEVASNGSKLIATLGSTLATDEASVLNASMLGGLAFNLQGADLIAREGMEAAVRSAQLDNNHAVFAALTRSSLDYGAVDVDGTNMLAGLAWRSTTGAGSMTYGVFAEHGDGSYDTYANINGTSLHGEGDTDYTGGGILARMDFNGSKNGHGYLEASGRVGNADTDYTNSGLRDAYGRAASYSTDGTYYGAHIGAGYVQKLDEKSSIDWYGKLFWARLEGGSADLSTGEHLTFDDADSLRLRIGGRWNYAASDFVSYYAGLGYEYEFDGEASGFTNGLALGDEDLTGGSGVAELGISFKPSKNSPFSLELNLAGFTGEREGFRGGVEAVYTF